jgi:hypothetical protein
MSAAKIEVGKVYKRGESEVYILYIQEKSTSWNDLRGCNMPTPEVIQGVVLSRRYDTALMKIQRDSIGEEVQKPYNKEEWGIKVLYRILFSEVVFMYRESRKGHTREATKRHIEKLYSEINDKCYSGARTIGNYKKFLKRKNALCRLVLKSKSKSRGAKQRSIRFDKAEPITLPICEECPKGPEDSTWSALDILRHTQGAKNHMNLTFREFTNRNLHKKTYEFDSLYPFQMSVLGYSRENEIAMSWLGIVDKRSYDLKKIEGQSYFPNALSSDGKHYVKPYGWPELYPGRVKTEEEAKALSGCKNKGGLTYPKWLSLNPSYISAICGHLVNNGSIKEMMSCKNCAIRRYKQWLK